MLQRRNKLQLHRNERLALRSPTRSSHTSMLAVYTRLEEEEEEEGEGVWGPAEREGLEEGHKEKRLMIAIADCSL